MLPDPQADPGGYVLAKADEVRDAAISLSRESPMLATFVLAQTQLWRGLVERHIGDHICSGQFPCPDLLAVVAACRAYAGTS